MAGASGDDGFLTTRWSIVRAANANGDPAAHAAWTTLCERYWPPLYAYARRSGLGADDAADAVQAFVLRLLERKDLGDAAVQGRFREYLLGALRHFLANERRAAATQKRGGHLARLDLAAIERGYLAEPAHRDTPERLFERRWATAVLAAALHAIETEYRERGRAELFAELRPWLDGDPAGGSQADAAARCGLAEGTFKVAVFRARQRFRRALRQEVADTLQDPADVDAELADLLRALGGA